MIDAEHCAGCRDDFYNGHNPYGIARCWLRDKGRLVERLLIPVDLAPPYDRAATHTVPNCYKPPRFVAVDPAALDECGCWKSGL